MLPVISRIFLLSPLAEQIILLAKWADISAEHLVKSKKIERTWNTKMNGNNFTHKKKEMR